MHHAELFGITIKVSTLLEGIALVEAAIASRKPAIFALANAHTFNLAYENPAYKSVLKASHVLRDGTGVRWALKRKGILPLHNFVGTDFIPTFFRHTASKRYRVYLLGAKPGVAEVAAQKLAHIAGYDAVVGYQHGYFKAPQTDTIIEHINKAKADVLIVAMGNPKQEVWIADNLAKLDTPACIGVGALFDYLSERVSRAPVWVRDMGMEWVYRLLVEPHRLWRRYIIGNCKFMCRVYRNQIVLTKTTRRIVR